MPMPIAAMGGGPAKARVLLALTGLACLHTVAPFSISAPASNTGTLRGNAYPLGVPPALRTINAPARLARTGPYSLKMTGYGHATTPRMERNVRLASE